MPKAPAPATAGSDSGTSEARHRRLMAWAGRGFGVGSALFMAGVPLSLVTSLPASVAGWTYFVGSVFFTTAATLQTIDAWRPTDETTTDRHRWTRADRENLLAAMVQWVGTVAFNVTTLRAALDAADRADYSAHVVWAPDAFGSVLFLAASAVALAPEVHRSRLRHVRDRAWVIAAVNMLGSLLFGVSAVGAWTDPSSGAVLSLAWANVGTFLGAMCFLIGSVLMLPRPRQPRALAP